MRKRFKGKKSQVLVISIFVFVLLFIFAFMIIEVGNLIYLKIHLQNIADSAAMEGGTWYARALNIVTLSNKVLFLVAAGGLATMFLTLGATTPAVKEAIEITQKIQDVFAGTGSFKNIRIVPALNAAAVIINGQRNENTLCIPIFNVEDFDLKDPLPSFNLKRRTLTDFLDSFDDKKDNKYYYRKKSTGEKVYVDEKDTRKNKIGWIIEKKTGKRLIKENKINLPSELNDMLGKMKEFLKDIDIPFDIVETGDHTILVVALQKDIKQITGSRFFIRKKSSQPVVPDVLIATAMVEIDGGKMDFWELDGASYTPKLRHIILPQIKITDGDGFVQLADFSRDTFSNFSTDLNINNILAFLTRANQFLTDNILLH